MIITHGERKITIEIELDEGEESFEHPRTLETREELERMDEDTLRKAEKRVRRKVKNLLSASSIGHDCHVEPDEEPHSLTYNDFSQLNDDLDDLDNRLEEELIYYERVSNCVLYYYACNDLMQKRNLKFR